MSKNSGFIGGAIFGAAVGVAAALLTAPKKGTELRKDAVDKYNDFKEDPQATIESLREFSVEKFYDVKDKFDSGEFSADSAKEYLLSRRDEIKEKVDSGELSVDTVKEFFSKTRENLSETLMTVKEELVKEKSVDEAFATEIEESTDESSDFIHIDLTDDLADHEFLVEESEVESTEVSELSDDLADAALSVEAGSENDLTDAALSVEPDLKVDYSWTEEGKKEGE